MRRFLLLCVAALVLVSCSNGNQPTPTATAISAPTAQPAAQQPAQDFGNGGTLIMTLGLQDPNTLDPALAGDVGSAFIIRQLFTGLVRLDATLEVQPDIAESWELSEDGLTYTFTLRPDARFADGTPITTADVAYSLERAADPQLSQFLPASTYLIDIVGVREKIAGQADSISGIQVVDEQTISITIDAPKSYFLAKLAHPTSYVVDQRTVESDPADWTEQPNGSGPFMIETWDHHQLLVLARNLNFYRDIPKLDRVRFLMGAAASNAQLLYEEGEIDVTSVPSYALARVQDASNPLSKELVSVPQLSITYLAMNVGMAPFDDPKVREAFAILIDRSKLAEVAMSDAVQPARGILPPGIPGYNEALPLPAPDLARAQALIAESSYGSAENLPPIAAYGGWAITLRQVAEEALGITIEVRDFEDYGDYLAALDHKEFQLYGSGWYADYPDPENFLDVLFRGNSGENHTNYASPEVDSLLDQAAIETDPEARYALYQQAESQILADAPVIPLYHDIEYTLIKPYVEGLEVTPMGILDLSTVELVR